MAKRKKRLKNPKDWHVILGVIFYILIFVCVANFVPATDASFLLYFVKPNAQIPEFLAQTITILIVIGIPFYFGYHRPYTQGYRSDGSYKTAKGAFNTIALMLVIIPPTAFLVVNLDKITCEPPEVDVAGTCCLTEEEYGVVLCVNESKRMTRRIMNAAINEDLTKGEYKRFGDIAVWVPPDYVDIHKVQTATLKIDLWLQAFVGDEDPVPLMIQYVYDNVIQYDSIYDMVIDAHEAPLHSASVLSKPDIYTGKKGTDIAILNMSTTYPDGVWWSAMGYIHGDGEYLMVIYQTEEPYFSMFYSEFLDIMYSVDTFMLPYEPLPLPE